MVDFSVTNHGTIYLLAPHSDRAEAWLREHVKPEQHQFFGRAIAVEHRYIHDIVEGAKADGLSID
jgi:hypothetical protein